MWFYHHNNEQTGPVDEDTLKQLISDGTLQGFTPVWQLGMENWLPLQQTHLKSFLITRPPELAPPTYRPPSVQNLAENITELKRLRNMYSYCIYACPVLLFVGLILVGISSSIPGDAGGILILFACLLELAPFVGVGIIFYLMLYKCWKALVPFRPPISAGLAVGLMFVPIYNFYWQFKAIYGLAVFVNQIGASRNSNRTANADLTLALCILSCLLVIPYLNFLLFIAWAVISIFVWKSIIDALEQLAPDTAS
jgi:GYF domain 2